MPSAARWDYPILLQTASEIKNIINMLDCIQSHFKGRKEE